MLGWAGRGINKYFPTHRHQHTCNIEGAAAPQHPTKLFQVNIDRGGCLKTARRFFKHVSTGILNMWNYSTHVSIHAAAAACDRTSCNCVHPYLPRYVLAAAVYVRGSIQLRRESCRRMYCISSYLNACPHTRRRPPSPSKRTHVQRPSDVFVLFTNNYPPSAQITLIFT